MSSEPWEVELSPTAVERVKRLPDVVRGELFVQLHKLERSPVQLSRTAPSPPYLPGFMMYGFWCEHLGQRSYITVLFKYGVDEQTIHVYSIGAPGLFTE